MNKKPESNFNYNTMGLRFAENLDKEISRITKENEPSKLFKK